MGEAELLSLTVHELRTPMTIVSGYLRMILDERAGPVPEPQRKLLREAEKSCARLSALIAELSDVSNLDAGTASFNRGPVNLVQLVEEAAAEVRGGGDPPASVEIRAQDADTAVDGDPVRLRHVVTSMCRALLREISRDHGLIIRCSVHDQDARLVFGDAPTLELLDASRAADLAPFDEWRGGSGLALPLARRVVEQHGGHVYSPRGERAKTGAIVVLPLRRPAA